MRELIETRYAVQAKNHVQTLLRYTEQARREIDAHRSAARSRQRRRPPRTRRPSRRGVPRLEADGARARAADLAIELYDEKGTLVSRFALNFPEYTAAAVQSSAGCDWDVFGEARRSARRSATCCTRSGASAWSTPPAAVARRSSCTWSSTTRRCPSSDRSPRTSTSFGAAGRRRPGRHRRRQRRIHDLRLGPAADLHVRAIAWPIDDAMFARVYRSREPFWTVAEGRREAPRLLRQRSRADLRHRLPGPHAVRSPRAPRRADDARRRGVRARADRQRAVHALARRARASAARCCARSAPASTASCSSRSCSRRSSRCSSWRW